MSEYSRSVLVFFCVCLLSFSLFMHSFLVSPSLSLSLTFSFSVFLFSPSFAAVRRQRNPLKTKEERQAAKKNEKDTKV